MAVAKRAQHRRSEVTNHTPENTHVETNEQQLPTLHEFMNAQGTDAYCDKYLLTVGISGLFFMFDKNGLLVRHQSIEAFVENVVS